MNAAPRLSFARAPDPEPQEPVGAEDLIRTAAAADSRAVHAFLTGLSPQARYRRFFTPYSSIPEKVVQVLTAQTSSRRNLIALRGNEIIGHAMAVVDNRGDVELALVVADGYRRRGIATRLMWSLIEQAAGEDASRLRFDMLAENRIMRDWLARCFPDAEYERDGETITMFVPLRSIMASEVAA